jgi:biopolymer transport protein TolR
MAMGGGPRSGGIKADINVTPLVDVVLVLLIIFMVVTPMLQRGKDVKLPTAHKTEQQKKDTDPIILSVTPDGQLYLENELLPKDQAQAGLGALLVARPGRKVLLKGDRTLKVKAVREVMNVARQAGAKGVALGVEEQKEL